MDERSLNNGSVQKISNVRYDKFACKNGTPSTPSCPNMAMGIKYIVGDEQNVDGAGRRRYVYCLEFAKDSPINGLTMQHVGWAGKPVAYALYYGAVYYGQPCRKAEYSTGNWQMDYFVTQAAVHILNGEFTLEAMMRGMNTSSATAGEKNLVYDRTQKIVADASAPGNYAGFTQDGWIDLTAGSFSLQGFSDSWSLQNGVYQSGGVFHGVFKSYAGYDFCEQLTGYGIEVPAGVTVHRRANQLYADFHLTVSEAQYRKWQLTGYTVPVKVTASIPRYWRGGIYQSGASNFQKICFLTWGSESGQASFEQTVNLHIPRQARDLIIRKKDVETGEALNGARFSLWGFDGSSYSKKVADFQDRGDGSYICKNVEYTQTKDGRFLIREDAPPKYYEEVYEWENEEDRKDYEEYGGREIHMNEDGFYSYHVSEPLVFREKKKIPQANVSILKYDIDNGKNLEGAEFAVYAWEKEKQAYGTSPIQTLLYDSRQQCYRTTELLTKDEQNQGRFLIRETRLPSHYHGYWQQEITVSEPGIVEIALEAPNYPEREFRIDKRIREDEVDWVHGNPTFFFRIQGTDVDGQAHTYHTSIEFSQEKMKEQGTEQGYLVGTTVVTGIPSGTYQVEEIGEVLRYVLTGAESSDENVRVSTKEAEKINGIQRITAVADADLRYQNGSITFENRKIFYDDYSDNAVVINHFKK